MDAFTDPLVHTVVLMKSAQTGGTEVLNNVVGYVIDQDPGPMLVLQPTIEMGNTWSKDRLAPMLRDSPSLAGKVKDRRSKDSENTILHKIFPGGHITVAGANSAASLASRPIRVLLADEVDRYPVSAGAEGDPLSLARKRLTTFWNRKCIEVSTPTIKGASRIEAEYAVSDQQRYFVPCPGCGQFQMLKWANVKWPDGDPDRAYYTCEKCGQEIRDAQKPAMLARGEWRPTAPGNGIRGFHINELYSPWVRFSDMAKSFLEAKRLPETLKTWVNTALGETWEEKGEQLEGSKLAERAENYEGPPEAVLLVTAAADVQDDRIEVEAIGWGKDYESWGLEHRAFYGDPSRPDIWEQLNTWLLRTWLTPDGRTLRIACAAVDSGGHHTQMVYAFCKPRYARRIYAIKGVGGQGRPLVGRPSNSNALRVRVFPIGVDSCKDLVFAHLRVATPGAAYCHFPASYDQECFEQLASEKVVTKYHHGFAKRVYIKVRPRNEMLDLRVYNRAALELLNPDFKKLVLRAKNVAKTAEKEPINAQIASETAEKPEKKQPTGAQTALQKRKPQKKSGWVNRWR